MLASRLRDRSTVALFGLSLSKPLANKNNHLASRPFDKLRVNGNL